jgi:hypothetical protein
METNVWRLLKTKTNPQQSYPQIYTYLPIKGENVKQSSS